MKTRPGENTTANHASMKYLLAAGFVIVGVVIAWRGLNRSLPGNSSSPQQPTVTTPGQIAVSIASYVPSAQMTFEVKPTAKTLDAVVAQAGERMTEIASTTLSSSQGLDPARLEELRRRFERHFGVILSGSYDAWLAQIDELGGRFEAPPGEPGGPLQKEQWEKQAAAFRLAPMSLRSLTVRPLYLRGKKIDHPTMNFWGHALYRGAYGAPDDPAAAELDVYEILLPMSMSADSVGARDKKMNVGFSYFWSNERSTWAPYEMQFYTDDGGRFIMFPF